MSLFDVLRPSHFVRVAGARRVALGIVEPKKRERVNPRGTPRVVAVARNSKRWRAANAERARATWRRYYRRKRGELKAKNLVRYHLRKNGAHHEKSIPGN